MKKQISLIFLFLNVIHASSQTNPPLYDLRIKQADSLYKLKQYEKSALMYYDAFKVFNGKGNLKDRFNVARCWALCGQNDSAFKNLDKIIRKPLFTDYEKLETEKDLNTLHTDKRWQPLIDTMNFHKPIKATRTNLKPAKISIKNNSIKSISLYLVDLDHNEIFYFDIDANKKVFIDSYIGTMWVLKRKAEQTQIIEFQITKQNQKFNTYGQIPD